MAKEGDGRVGSERRMREGALIFTILPLIDNLLVVKSQTTDLPAFAT